ncbi:B-cell scaffold protein with ankyrin repeats-like isoform X2 [Poeciliopsis prolifica]|uniref:B-cell scaffold protein with ankyrin repeats-like isoform X2 n=1 Tax=Poeciliopsis prolifica TaxID=188132 RepID=UPI0024132138|nr:B-cell scaffold protein with ankyrin repeats-like isoform X2 [Poeciliopsis prolifica]
MQLKYEGKPLGIPTEKLLIIYETEAKQWATYLQSAFTGHIPEDGICCYDVNTPSRKDDFVKLSCYACKLLILSKGMMEGLHQMRRIFLSRVLSPAACVVVLLCGVDSLTPLLDRVPINGDECLQISCKQDAPEYVSNVMDIIRKGGSAMAANANPMTQRPSGSEQRDEQMQSSGADRLKSRVVIVPSRVPCGSSSEVFVLLKNDSAACDCEVEFKAERKIERVKPVCWSERILCVSTPADFPAGNVRVTVYSGGKTLTSSKLQYFTRIEELARLLSSVADPVEFMCQALQACSVEKLDQKLSSMLLELMPTGGFQGLQAENMQEREVHHGDVPTLLHFAARYGFRSVSGLLLQCPGAERALRMANQHGQTPAEIAKSHGHKELHVILTEKLRMRGSSDDNSVYEMMCNPSKQRQCEGEDEDVYTPLRVNDESNSNSKSEKTLDLTNRPPAPTPRPEGMQLKESRTPYIAQVFKKKKIPKADTDVYSLTSKQAQKQTGSTSGTYDTFVPNRMQLEQLAELQQRIKTGSLSKAKGLSHLSDQQQQQQQVEKSAANRQEEKLSYPRAGIINNRDDCLYDEINNVHLKPSYQVKESRRENQPFDSGFYTKPLKKEQVKSLTYISKTKNFFLQACVFDLISTTNKVIFF